MMSSVVYWPPSRSHFKAPNIAFLSWALEGWRQPDFLFLGSWSHFTSHLKAFFGFSWTSDVKSGEITRENTSKLNPLQGQLSLSDNLNPQKRKIFMQEVKETKTKSSCLQLKCLKRPWPSLRRKLCYQKLYGWTTQTHMLVNKKQSDKMLEFQLPTLKHKRLRWFVRTAVNQTGPTSNLPALQTFDEGQNDS